MSTAGMPLNHATGGFSVGVHFANHKASSHPAAALKSTDLPPNALGREDDLLDVLGPESPQRQRIGQDVLNGIDGSFSGTGTGRQHQPHYTGR
jgi:hypothetical protein